MNTIVQARIDAATKKEAEQILKRLGLSLSDGIRMFISQVTVNRGMPFQSTLENEPNERVQRAMCNALEGQNLETIGSVEDFKKMCEDL